MKSGHCTSVRFFFAFLRVDERNGDFSTVMLSSWRQAIKITSIAMKMLWCWRCKAEMPMLDDEEYSRVTSFRPTVERGQSLQQRFAGMLAEYERITGFRETNPNAVFHHRLSDYGPPCRFCGKPLRTPHARLCGNCMRPIAGDVQDLKTGQ